MNRQEREGEKKKEKIPVGKITCTFEHILVVWKSIIQECQKSHLRLWQICLQKCLSLFLQLPNFSFT